VVLLKVCCVVVIYKGHDRASVAMREADKTDGKGNIDEIKHYRDARWVTPQKPCGGYMALT
jgi:hypothetical protein